MTRGGGRLAWGDVSELDERTAQRLFRLELPDSETAVPGVVWTPVGAERPSIALVGHAGFSHKLSPGMVETARALTRSGFVVVALDAPLHGERRPAELADPWREWMEYWRRTSAQDFASEWSRVLTLFRIELGEAPAAFWGLSLATQYGLALLAHDRRIVAAVLGLFGLHGDQRLAQHAASTSCPIYFIEQEADEFHPSEETQALFDRINASVKERHVGPGGHFDLQSSIRSDAIRFLEQRVAAHREVRTGA